jgi:hypothetical protein
MAREEMVGAAESIPRLMGFSSNPVDMDVVRTGIAAGMRSELSDTEGSPTVNALRALEAYAAGLADDSRREGHSTGSQFRLATYLGHILNITNGAPVQLNSGEGNGQ